MLDVNFDIYSVNITTALRVKIITLLTFTLTAVFYPPAYGISDTRVEQVSVELTDDNPALLFVQVTPKSTASEGFELTPQLAADTLQAAMRRGEAISLTSDLGRIIACAPLQIDTDRFVATVFYSLYAADHQNGQDSSILSQAGADQQASSLSAELEVDDTELACQPSENSTLGQPEQASNGEESIDDTADLALEFTLQGSLDQLVNAAAFLGSAIARGVSLEYVEAGANMAIVGVDYGLTTDLMVVLMNTLILDSSDPDYVQVDVNLLRTAILLNNQIVKDSSDATVSALAENPYFLQINDTLQYFRSKL